MLFTLGLSPVRCGGPMLAHILLSFPTGRLETRNQRALIGAVVRAGPARASSRRCSVSAAEDITDCEGDCPRNLLLDRAQRASSAKRCSPPDRPSIHDAHRCCSFWLLAVKWRAAEPAPSGAASPRCSRRVELSLACVVAFAATEAPALLTLAFASFAVDAVRVPRRTGARGRRVVARYARLDGPAGRAPGACRPARRARARARRSRPQARVLGARPGALRRFLRCLRRSCPPTATRRVW